MTRAQLSQVVIAAGALVGLVTVSGAGGGGSIWSVAEPYVVHGAVGAAAGLAAAIGVAFLWRRPAVAARPRRQAIPQRVRHEVWRRDCGSCVECGSRARLEFDHIVPVSRGGSNTTRNIELRCEPCNRRKGARI
jgi:HNH endonuclease